MSESRPIFNYRDLDGQFKSFPALRGERGSDTLFSIGPPLYSLGRVGDFVFSKIGDKTYLYGPKTLLGWPGEGTLLTGDSAYEIWLSLGNEGTIEEYNSQLSGVYTGSGAPPDGATVWVDSEGGPSLYGLIQIISQEDYNGLVLDNLVRNNYLYITETKRYLGQEELLTKKETEEKIKDSKNWMSLQYSGVYEGNNLEVTFSDEITVYGDVWSWLKARVQSNSFNGLNIHDYILVQFMAHDELYNLKFEIVGINTYKGSGNPEIPSHIDLISRDLWRDTVKFNLVRYNNGLGVDKFIGDGATLNFQLTHRGDDSYPLLSGVTVAGAPLPVEDYNYNVETGLLELMTAPGNLIVVKAIWETPILYPFLVSNLNAYLNSLRMGVPNEQAHDPLLVEVDYRENGIYNFLPAEMKAAITPKFLYTATRYSPSTLLTASNNYGEAWIGPLWIPDEMEIYGAYMSSANYDKWYTRLYPAYQNGNRRKGVGDGGGRASWWLFPADGGSSQGFCFVNSAGRATTNGADGNFRVPIGVRIQQT